MRPFVLMMVIACSTIVSAADPEIGDLVFVKLDATGRVGDQAVEWSELPFPAQVKEIDADNVRLSKIWVRKLEVMNAEDALRYFSEQIEREPDRANAWSCRGVLWNLQKEPDKAISDLTQAICLAPHETRNYVRRANAWFSVAIKHQFSPPIHSGGFQVDIQILPEKEIAMAHAMVDCCDAIQIDPRCADAYLCRAHLWTFKEQWKTARSDFRQAVMLDPGSPRANVELARFSIAHPFPGLVNSSEAIRCATTACELTDWESFDEVDTLVRACVASSALEAAAKWSEKAIVLLPQARQQFIRDEYRKLLDREPAPTGFRILQIQE